MEFPALTRMNSTVDKKRGGQASLEFMTVMAALVVVLFLIGYTIYTNYVKSYDLKVYIDGQHLANYVADGLNSINSAPNGQSTHMSLPSKLYGERSYFVRFYPGESRVFIDGTQFTSGRDTVFSSPITTDKIVCFLQGCMGTCNRSVNETCLEVTDNMRFRMVKYKNRIHLTNGYNVIQGDTREFIHPYEGDGDFELENITDIANNFGSAWNMMHLYKNTRDQSLSLVFSMNLSGGESCELNISEVRGDILAVKSNDTGEFMMAHPLNMPDGSWQIPTGADWDVDGAIIKFRDGANICVEPVSMPTTQWVLLGYGGERIALSKSKKICITYP
ncbi:MAG: hypothetical protein KKD39_07105 [Candidatus Altiarchaeota archaeon]|nr:hypothetical protein [Candidatus Altiarchaeota archaeon]